MAVLETSLYGRIMDIFWNKTIQFSQVLNSNVKWVESVLFAYNSHPIPPVNWLFSFARPPDDQMRRQWFCNRLGSVQ